MSDRTNPLRVAIAENSALFRRGLVLQLASGGVEVTDECGSAEELMPRLRANPPDIVLMDIRMPPTETDEGIRAATEIRAELPQVGILVLSTYVETAYAAAVISIGASAIGYLLKDRVTNIHELLDAIDRITAGECVIDGEIIQALLHRPPRQRALEALSDRERTVLRLMAEGRSNASIAQQLYLTVRTIEAHTAAIFNKLGLSEDPETNRRVAAVITWLRGV